MPQKKIKKLYRAKEDRMLGGVCAGIAAYLKVDPTVIRVVWILLTLVSLGVGILGYLILWLLIPEKP